MDLLDKQTNGDYWAEWQGNNGTAFALLALDSHNYLNDAEGNAARAAFINSLKDNQMTSGAWAISESVPAPSIDVTAAAIYALAPYYLDASKARALGVDPNDVKQMVDKALDYLSGQQNSSGGFGSAEADTWVIIALSTLGRDAATDPQFTKSNGSLLADMLSYQDKTTGGFRHTTDGSVDQMATEQAAYGLVAYDRFKNGKNTLYDMSDVQLAANGEPSGQNGQVQRVTLNASEITLSVGETATLTATVYPANATEKTVTWTSSDRSVATVSKSGQITALAEGSATITASAGGKTAACEVTVSQIAGYVIVSFEDYGIRKSDELNDIEAKFRSPLGMIIKATRVPFKKNDTIASVTLRLLEEEGFTASYQGSENRGFYLESIGNFYVKGTYYRSFGEFDAGRDSGWMITWNDWFIDQGASEFTVEDGDVIRWQYTCQLGADIGNDYSEAAQKVMGMIAAIGEVTKDSGPAIKAARDAYDALTPAQKTMVTNYGDLVAAETKYAALPKDEGKMAFTDVSASDYYFDAVQWAVENGITNGTSTTTFSPNASCTRAQMVTFLWRAAGSPKAKTTACAFTDVNKSAYYYEALLWAVENGITNGTSATTFSPYAECTRGQMVTFLYRDAKQPAVSGRLSFRDVPDDAFYRDAVIWAVNAGITNGTGATAFSPDAVCTRGQMVTFLYRYLAVAE